MLEALRTRLRALHDRAGKHRLPLRTAPDLPKHRASKGQGGFTWRGRFIPLANYPLGITRRDVETLYRLAPMNWAWPL